MRASQRILSQVRGDLPPDMGAGQLFSSTMDGVSLRVTLNDWDRLAVSLVDLEAGTCPSASLVREEGFNEFCERLAEKLNYLEEPLKAIEVDGASGTAIIRSYPPVREGDTFLYYEIRIRGSDGVISMRRRKKHGSVHQDVAEKAVLGYHLFARLMDDLFDTLSSSEDGEGTGNH